MNFLALIIKKLNPKINTKKYLLQQLHRKRYFFDLVKSFFVIKIPFPRL